MTIRDFEISPESYIWLNEGSIEYDSIFERDFDGDLKLLLDCCTDNIYLDEVSEEEQIDYEQTIKDYENENSGNLI